MRMTMNGWWSGLGLALVLGAAPALRAEPVTNLFGFSGKESYPIDDQISLLHAADLDGDGLTDLIVANNLRSKINVLYNLTGKTNRTAVPARKLELNELPPDARFRIDSIPTDERIAAGGDGFERGRPPGHHLLRRHAGTGGALQPGHQRLERTQTLAHRGRPDVRQRPGHRRLERRRPTDVVLLGENGAVYFLPQKPDHTFGEPQKIPYSGSPKAVQIVDMDGDGRTICCW